ncbi:hypothetical protein EVAR_37110_1 [Eumeta japonica]|uniref:Uncharacterized protein n=1 Tax=Eumeta variegata TaxID=151549 RepID=A0A4C1XQK5_EUMVA|nr:hypothetical protein EVAR_37110_1 [Eumeta japonica]
MLILLHTARTWWRIRVADIADRISKSKCQQAGHGAPGSGHGSGNVVESAPGRSAPAPPPARRSSAKFQSKMVFEFMYQHIASPASSSDAPAARLSLHLPVKY